jgi:hypothetical protein
MNPPETSFPPIPDGILTELQIYKRLGLDPDFDGFPQYVEHRPRRTGRTTKILIQAAHAAQTGKVAILGSSPHQSWELSFTLRNMAYAIGANQENVIITRCINSKPKDILQRGLNMTLFYDHAFPHIYLPTTAKPLVE